MNTQDNKYGGTPLHAAAHSKAPSIVAALVKKAGADLTARDKEGRTPLHVAAWRSKMPAVVETLLDAGADPLVEDKAGRTPWDLAKNNAALEGTKVYLWLKQGRVR